MKSNDLDLKYSKALEYFEEGKCVKSMTILEELIPLTRGTVKSENIYYYYAKSVYCNEDYILGGYYFENFVKTFPNSQYSEECAYMTAFCRVKESPEPSLDQTPTKHAIEGLQLFVNQYPNTSRKDTINVMIKNLRSKLEMKSFENAKQYYHTRKYKSAVIALENSLTEFPDSRYREEMNFLLLASHYELAINSIESKKEVRLKDTVKSYHNFVDNFESSRKMKEAADIYDSAVKALDQITAKKN